MGCGSSSEVAVPVSGGSGGAAGGGGSAAAGASEDPSSSSSLAASSSVSPASKRSAEAPSEPEQKSTAVHPKVLLIQGKKMTYDSGKKIEIDIPELPEGANFDPKNPEQWEAYIQRQTRAQEELVKLAARTQPRKQPPLPADIEVIRPFLSSTFRDFNDERNAAISENFPKVEKLCTERGKIFAPLDLRWGVTSDQSNGGLVIKLCLDEIERSRPYFVCSLGFRNGWCLNPDDDPTNQYVKLLQDTFDIGIQHYDWVKHFRDRSVTEIEILNGALLNQETMPRVFVYFRDVEYLKQVPIDQRFVYAEMGISENKIIDIKRRLIEAGYPIKFFKSPREWGQIVQQDMEKSISADFPVVATTPLELQLKGDMTAATQLSACYIGGEKYLERLDAYMKNGGKPLLVSGRHGAGKSAMIANWTSRRYPKAEFSVQAELEATKVAAEKGEAPAPLPKSKDIPKIVIRRIIGMTAESTAIDLLLLRIMEEGNLKLRLDCELPTEAKKIIAYFSQWLEETCAVAQVTLIFDGLQELSDSNDAHSMTWFPKTLPPSLRLIMTASKDSDPYAALLEETGMWDELVINSLSDEHCEQLCMTYLSIFGKQLARDQMQRVRLCPHTRNPMYLRTFLNEVRGFGSYEALNDRINWYLEAESITEMFCKTIERLEDDFKDTAPDLVRSMLCSIYCSRNGLTEPEIHKVVERCLSEVQHYQIGGEVSVPKSSSAAGLWGRRQSELSRKAIAFPQLDFSAAAIRVDKLCIDQSGLKKFSHAFVRRAVACKYFGYTLKEDLENRKRGGIRGLGTKHVPNELFILHHKMIAFAFESMPVTPRRAYELPYQYQFLAKQSAFESLAYLDSYYDKLHDTLIDLDMFLIMKMPLQRYDLHLFWHKLEEAKGLNCSKSYLAALKLYDTDRSPDPVEFAEVCASIGYFLLFSYRFDNVDAFFDQSIEILKHERGPRHGSIQPLLTSKADYFFRMHQHAKAGSLYQEGLEILKLQQETPELQKSKLAIEVSLGNVLKEQGKLTEAEETYKLCVELQIATYGNDSYSVALSRINLAELYLRQSNVDDAVPLYETALKVVQLEKGSQHPQVATILSDVGCALWKAGKYEEAEKNLTKALSIKEAALGTTHYGLAIILNNLGMVSYKKKDFSSAVQFFMRKAEIDSKTKTKHSKLDMAQTYLDLGHVYAEHEKASDHRKRALEFYSKSLALRKSVVGTSDESLIEVLQAMAENYRKMKPQAFTDAIACYTEAIGIKKAKAKDSKDNQPEIAGFLAEIAFVHFDSEVFPKAVENLENAIKMYEDLGAAKNLLVASLYHYLGIWYCTVVEPEGSRDNDGKRMFEKAYILREELAGKAADVTVETKKWICDLCALEFDELPEDFNILAALKEAEM